MKFGNLLATIVISLMMHSSLSHAAFTFSNVSYTADSVTFTIDGDMSGYAVGNSEIGFSLVYAGDIMMPAMTAGNSWSRSVFDNKTILQLGATDDFLAGDYTWSKYASPSLQDASVSNATVTVTFSHAHLNVSAVSPSISFIWGIGPEGTVLATVVPTLGAATFSVGGTVSGLTGTGLALQNNGGDTLAVAAAATAFTFATELPDLATYAVMVSTQPTGQTCSVTGGDNSIGGGAIAGADVTSVVVTCVDDVIPTYTVGGTVSGLTGSGLELQNNGSDTLPVAAAATSFIFATALADGAGYSVTVSTQPTGQTCNVGNDSGSISSANITNVTVTCVDDVIPTYSVGGTTTGLTSTGLQLQNNGVDTLSIAADGTFVFATELVDLSAYAITLSAQPSGQTCSVTNGSGTIAAADIANVAVDCVDDQVPPVIPPEPAKPIPTLSGWALLLLLTLTGLVVVTRRRRIFQKN